MKAVEKSITFLNSKGEKLWGILALPSRGSDFPAVIMCHGFGQTKSQRKFAELSRVLAQNGIASFRFDFSGHGDSEGKFEALDIEKQVEELKLGFDNVLQNPNIDKNKITILGHSLAALVAVLFQVKYKLAKTLILFSPALHQKELVSQWYTKEDIDLWKTQGFLDTKKGRVAIEYLNQAQSKNWQEIVQKIEIPTLLIHGAQDEDVPLQYTKNLFSKLICKKKLEIIDQTDHHFETHDSKQKLTEVCLNWIQK